MPYFKIETKSGVMPYQVWYSQDPDVDLTKYQVMPYEPKPVKTNP